MQKPFYNAHHAPVGAFATLTLGCKGAKGGLGLELAGPADESLYIGLEDREGGTFRALPFFDVQDGRADDFDVEHLAGFTCPSAVFPFADGDIERTMGAGIDEWRAGDLAFRVISPVRSVPDPENSAPDKLRDVVCPAVLAELTVDNRAGTAPRRAFFGYAGSDRATGMRLLEGDGLVGVAQHTMTAIATDDPDVRAGIAFQPERILQPTSEPNLAFLVGDLGLLVGTVRPGEVRTFRFAVAFFREGTATTGIKTRYLYRRFFDGVEDVLRHALARFDDSIREAKNVR